MSKKQNQQDKLRQWKRVWTKAEKHFVRQLIRIMLNSGEEDIPEIATRKDEKKLPRGK